MSQIGKTSVPAANLQPNRPSVLSKKKSFAEAFADAFEKGECMVLHYACSLEDHHHGGKHYQCRIQLSLLK